MPVNWVAGAENQALEQTRRSQRFKPNPQSVESGNHRNVARRYRNCPRRSACTLTRVVVASALTVQPASGGSATAVECELAVLVTRSVNNRNQNQGNRNCTVVRVKAG